MVRSGILVLVAVAAFACGPDRPPGEVGLVAGQAFAPREVTIAAGDTVTWVGEDDEQHTVTAYEDSLPEGASFFASGGSANEDDARAAVTKGLLGEGDTFEVTFDVPGTYRYFCVPHEAQGMTGTIVVE